MAATWMQTTANRVSLATGRADVVLAGLSAVVPLFALFAVHAGAEALEIVPVMLAPFGLPVWISGIALMIMLPMFGVSRWMVCRHGDDGHTAGHWIEALMVAVIFAPFALGAVDVFFAAIITMVVLLTGIIAAGRTIAVSAPAAMLLLPGLLWTGAGTLIGFSAMTGGWAPPFAVTDTHGQA